MKRLILCGIALVSCMMLGAQGWTLDDCIKYAMQNNITIRKNRVAEETGVATLKQNQSALWPSVSFSTSHNMTYRPMEGGTARSEGGEVVVANNKVSYNGSYGINMNWTVWNGGVNYKTVEQQKLQNEINKLATETSELTIQEQIVQLYVQIMYTREAVKVNEELAKVAEAQYNRGVQMQKQGQMAHADVVKLEAQFQDAKYDIINSQTQVDNYKRQLKSLLQLDINTGFDVTGEIPSDEKPLEIIPAAGEVYARALTTRPEIESAQKSIANAELQYDIAKRGYYPTISVNASVSDAHNSNSTFSYGEQFKNNLGLGAGVNVSVPIWDARKTRTAKEKALLSKQTAELELENKKNALSSTIEAHWLNANNGQQKFIAADTKGKSQKESYILTNQQFQNGLKNVVDVLQSRSLVLQAAQDKLQSKYMTLMNMQLLKFYMGEKLDL
ncbi:MAG: TolC family protein [Bacteroidaceae bacterium]|nr:TolC family protein [Bacteroidaceae bacterium]